VCSYLSHVNEEFFSYLLSTNIVKQFLCLPLVKSKTFLQMRSWWWWFDVCVILLQHSISLYLVVINNLYTLTLTVNYHERSLRTTLSVAIDDKEILNRYCAISLKCTQKFLEFFLNSQIRLSDIFFIHECTKIFRELRWGNNLMSNLFTTWSRLVLQGVQVCCRIILHDSLKVKGKPVDVTQVNSITRLER